MSENIFYFNPLTALFLAGVGTQLFVLVCDNVLRTKQMKKGTLLKLDSDKRMDRWQMCFSHLCRNVFDNHSLEDENTQFDGNLNKNPFVVHLTLLTKHSEAILYFVRRNNLGKNTLKNVSSWFDLMVSLENSRLGRHFGNSFQTLIGISKTYLQSAPSQTSSTNHRTWRKEYPHFSPGALYIRSAYVLHIHKHQFCPHLMVLWESGSANFLSHFLQLPDYFIAHDCSMDRFSPYFPYLHHLPCKLLYNVWNLSAQVSERVPFHNIFNQIIMSIYGNAITFNTSNSLGLHHCENDHEQVLLFQIILREACTVIDMEMQSVLNCEKQRRHRIKKRGNGLENISYTKRSRQVVNPNWSCPFLFPSKYFEHTDSTAGTETFAC